MSLQLREANLAATKHSVLNIPISQIMRPEIALPLQHILQVHTVGGFLNAWREPRNQRQIEQLFDSPQQARHAAAVCATWLGVKSNLSHVVAGAWWAGEDRSVGNA